MQRQSARGSPAREAISNRPESLPADLSSSFHADGRCRRQGNFNQLCNDVDGQRPLNRSASRWGCFDCRTEMIEYEHDHHASLFCVGGSILTLEEPVGVVDEFQCKEI